METIGRSSICLVPGVRGGWLLILLLHFWLLSGCGFHLRGAVEYPPSMQETYIDGNPASAVVRELRLNLEASGASIVDSPQAAGATLHILGETFERRVLSVRSNAQVSEYELIYKVRFSVTRADGVQLLTPQEINVVRDYRYDPNQVLGSSSEESLLQEEMRRDVSQLILRRLAHARAPS